MTVRSSRANRAALFFLRGSLAADPGRTEAPPTSGVEPGTFRSFRALLEHARSPLSSYSPIKLPLSSARVYIALTYIKPCISMHSVPVAAERRRYRGAAAIGIHYRRPPRGHKHFMSLSMSGTRIFSPANNNGGCSYAGFSLHSLLFSSTGSLGSRPPRRYGAQTSATDTLAQQLTA